MKLYTPDIKQEGRSEINLMENRKGKTNMDKHYLLFFCNPVEGREDEYNKWYTDTHLQDVVKVTGFV